VQIDVRMRRDDLVQHAVDLAEVLLDMTRDRLDQALIAGGDLHVVLSDVTVDAASALGFFMLIALRPYTGFRSTALSV
jgi:hypothetical protein